MTAERRATDHVINIIIIIIIVTRIIFPLITIIFIVASYCCLTEKLTEYIKPIDFTSTRTNRNFPTIFCLSVFRSNFQSVRLVNFFFQWHSFQNECKNITLYDWKTEWLIEVLVNVNCVLYSIAEFYIMSWHLHTQFPSNLFKWNYPQMKLRNLQCQQVLLVIEIDKFVALSLSLLLLSLSQSKALSFGSVICKYMQH